MVDCDPPLLPFSVGKVVGTGGLTEDLVAELSDQFQFTKEDGVPLSAENRYGLGVQFFLPPLVSRVYPVPQFEWMVLLKVDPYRTVHILHSLFSVPVNLYSMAQHLFACC